jgi:DNA-binding SARP family transcriptional activator
MRTIFETNSTADRRKDKEDGLMQGSQERCMSDDEESRGMCLATTLIQALPYFRIHTFGPFHLERLVSTDATEEPCYQEVGQEEWGGRTASMSLLKLLLCCHQRHASKSFLAGTLWPEKEEERARHNLTQAVGRLQKLLRTPSGEELLTETVSGSGGSLQLAQQSLLWIDADAFELGAKQAALAERQGRCEEALLSWEQAYHVGKAGTFLADDLHCAWTEARRLHLEHVLPRCVQRLAECYLAQARYTEAEDVLHFFWINHLTDEDVAYQLMALYSERGWYQKASRVYERTARALDEELDVQPEIRLKRLAEHIHEKMQSFEPSTASSSLHALLSGRHAVTQNGLLLPCFSEQGQDSTSLDSTTWVGVLVGRFNALVADYRGQARLGADLQQLLDREFTTMKPHEHVKQTLLPTRRSVLAAMATAPLALALKLLQPGQRSIVATEDFLNQCSASVTACWHLLNGNGRETVAYTLPKYLPALLSLVEQSCMYREIAAYLAAQACLLMGLVEHHRFHFQQRVDYCTQAVQLADTSGDPTLQVVALIHLGGVLGDLGRHRSMLETQQKALQYTQKISSDLHSKLLAELSHAHAKNGREQEALNCLSEARALFSGTMSNAPVFLTTDYGLPQLILFEGQTRLTLGDLKEKQDHPAASLVHYRQSEAALAQVEQLWATDDIPDRFNLEIINHRALAAVKTGDLGSFCRFAKQGMEGAYALGSEKRRQEVLAGIDAAQQMWPYQTEVQDLVEQYVAS